MLKIKCRSGTTYHSGSIFVFSFPKSEVSDQGRRKIEIYLPFTVDYRQVDYRQMTLDTGKIQIKYNFFHNFPWQTENSKS